MVDAIGHRTILVSLYSGIIHGGVAYDTRNEPDTTDQPNTRP